MNSSSLPLLRLSINGATRFYDCTVQKNAAHSQVIRYEYVFYASKICFERSKILFTYLYRYCKDPKDNSFTSTSPVFKYRADVQTAIELVIRCLGLPYRYLELERTGSLLGEMLL